MCNHAKSTNYQAERILFLSIMRIVAPSGLRLSSPPAHTPQADTQSGEIVQRGGGGWRQDSGYAQSDQSTIEAHDKTIIGMDARLPAEPCHILRLVGRKDSGAEAVHSHLGGNGCGGAVTVAGEYIGAGDAVGHQILHLGVVRLMSQTTKLDFLRNSSYTNNAACDWKLGWNLRQVDA